MKFINNIKCFLFGHKISEESDCGYCYCERSNHHEYYNYKTFWLTIPTMLRGIKLRVKLFKEKVYENCDDCKKPLRRFGKWVGEHNNCLPF